MFQVCSLSSKSVEKVGVEPNYKLELKIALLFWIGFFTVNWLQKVLHTLTRGVNKKPAYFNHFTSTK